jgi:hypothetical protein
MLDPLTALSLAGNILQFVDFAGKLLIKGKEIYQSGDGLSIGDHELQTIAQGLRDINARFQSHVSARVNGQSIATNLGIDKDARLVVLGDQCSAVADELIDAVEKLKVSGLSGSSRHWNSFRQALKSLWKKERLEAIVMRLQALREEWSFHILVSLR